MNNDIWNAIKALSRDGNVLALAVMYVRDELAGFTAKPQQQAEQALAEVDALRNALRDAETRIKALEDRANGNVLVTLTDVPAGRDVALRAGEQVTLGTTTGGRYYAAEGEPVAAAQAYDLTRKQAVDIATAIIRWRASPGDPAASLVAVREITNTLGPSVMEEAQRGIANGREQARERA